MPVSQRPGQKLQSKLRRRNRAKACSFENLHSGPKTHLTQSLPYDSYSFVDMAKTRFYAGQPNARQRIPDGRAVPNAQRLATMSLTHGAAQSLSGVVDWYNHPTRCRRRN